MLYGPIRSIHIARHYFECIFLKQPFSQNTFLTCILVHNL